MQTVIDGYWAAKRVVSGESPDDSSIARTSILALSPGVSALLLDSEPVPLGLCKDFFSGTFLNWEQLTQSNVLGTLNLPQTPQTAEDAIPASIPAWKGIALASQGLLESLGKDEFNENFARPCAALTISVQECWDLLHTADLRLASCAIFLSLLERLLGNIFTAAEPLEACPRILRDLLSSSPLTAALGPDLLFALRCLLGPPTGLNLRNIVWHGFLAPTELPDSYAFLAFLTAISVAQFSLSLPMQFSSRPKLPLDSAFLLRPTPTDQPPLTPAVLDVIRQLCTESYFILPGRESLVQLALVHLGRWLGQGPDSTLHLSIFLSIVLPQLEHSLRRIFVAVNNLPSEFICANARLHYTTMDMFLSPEVELEGFPTTPNRLQSEIGRGIWELLLDLIVSPEGPRIRDRLSHAEADVSRISPRFIEMLVAALVSLLCLLTPPSNIPEDVQPTLAWVHRYQTVFHPLSKLRMELESSRNDVASLFQAAERYCDEDGPLAEYALRSDPELESWLSEQAALVAEQEESIPEVARVEWPDISKAVGRNPVIVVLRSSVAELVSYAGDLAAKTQLLRELVSEGRATRRLESSLYKLMSVYTSLARLGEILHKLLLLDARSLSLQKRPKLLGVMLERLRQRVQANEWTEAVKVLRTELPVIIRAQKDK